MTQQRKPPAKRLFKSIFGVQQPSTVPATEAKPVQPKAKTVKVPVEKAYCLIHASPRPCSICVQDELGDLKFAERRKNVEVLNAVVRAEWAKIAQAAGIRPGQKCVHGHMHAESYCDVCRFSPIDPGYNPDVYRAEIKKALTHARSALYGLEGKKDFEDLTKIVDMEIWRASKKYGAEMNTKLAYTVAYNQAQKYLAERIEEQTVVVIGPGGKPVLDEYGYPVRQPRFASMDDKPQDDRGEEMEESAAELEVHQQETAQGSDWLQSFINNGGSESLKALAASWHGDKRLVAEAMLKPGFAVRDVPGVSKSQASRVRQVVLREFKSFISKGLTK